MDQEHISRLTGGLEEFELLGAAIDLFRIMTLRIRPGNRYMWVSSTDPKMQDILSRYDGLFTSRSNALVTHLLVFGRARLKLDLFGAGSAIQILEADDPQEGPDVLRLDLTNDDGRSYLEAGLELMEHKRDLTLMPNVKAPQTGKALRDLDRRLTEVLRFHRVLQGAKVLGRIADDKIVRQEYPQSWEFIVRVREVVSAGLKEVCCRHMRDTGFEGFEDLIEILVPPRNLGLAIQ